MTRPASEAVCHSPPASVVAAVMVVLPHPAARCLTLPTCHACVALSAMPVEITTFCHEHTMRTLLGLSSIKGATGA